MGCGQLRLWGAEGWAGVGNGLAHTALQSAQALNMSAVVEQHLILMDIHTVSQSKQSGVLTGSIAEPLHACWIVVSEEVQAIRSGHKVDAMKVHSVGPPLCCQSCLPPLLSLICQLYSTEHAHIATQH